MFCNLQANYKKYPYPSDIRSVSVTFNIRSVSVSETIRIRIRIRKIITDTDTVRPLSDPYPTVYTPNCKACTDSLFLIYIVIFKTSFVAPFFAESYVILIFISFQPSVICEWNFRNELLFVNF